MTLELIVQKDLRSDKYMPKIQRGHRSYNGRLCGSVASAERDLEEFFDRDIEWQHPVEGSIPGRGLIEGTVRSQATIDI